MKKISVYAMIDLILNKMRRYSDIRETPKGYSVRCLSNSHDDKHPSCIVYHDGWVKCFSCGFSQPINKIALNLGLKERVNYQKKESKPYVYQELVTFATDFVSQPERMNQYLQGYIKSRMITNEFIKWSGMFEWRNGYCRYADNLTPYETFDRMAFPIYDPDGRLISYELRKYKNFEDNWPKVLYPTNSPHKRFVYNQVNWDKFSSIYITEGMLDLPQLFMNVGPERIGCIFGSQISDHQIDILCSIPNLIICVDRDNAGLEMVAKIAKKRLNFNILIPHNSDLGADTPEMVDDDIKNRTISYNKFISEVDMDWFLDPSYEQMYDSIHYTTDFE